MAQITTTVVITITSHETTNNTNIYQNHQHRQPVNSNKLAHNSDPLNSTPPTLPNTNTPLPHRQRQKLVQFNTEHVLLNNSTQSTPTTGHNIQITPKKLVNLVRQLNSQNNQQSTKAHTPYYLQAASTKTLSPVVRRNTQLMYPYLGGSVPIQHSLRPCDGTDPTYTTEDFLNAITANMVMTAGPEQTDSPYHEAWILKRIAMIQTALIGTTMVITPSTRDKKRTGKRFAANFKKRLKTNNRKHKQNYY